MKLTKSVDFAMRVLIRLAREGGPLTMPVLSKELAISYHHLSKLVQRLRDGEFLRTIQGKYGGVVLGKAPELVSLRMVVELMDGPTRLSECLDTGHCFLSSDCKLKTTLSGVQADINDRLDAVTLSGLL